MGNMVNSDNITVTDARVHNALDKKINQVIDKRDIPKMIQDMIKIDIKKHSLA